MEPYKQYSTDFSFFLFRLVALALFLLHVVWSGCKFLLNSPKFMPLLLKRRRILGLVCWCRIFGICSCGFFFFGSLHICFGLLMCRMWGKLNQLFSLLNFHLQQCQNYKLGKRSRSRAPKRHSYHCWLYQKFGGSHERFEVPNNTHRILQKTWQN